MRSVFSGALVLAGALVLSACATMPNEEPNNEDVNKTAATIYDEAKSALDRGDYETSIQKLESLEARFPFGIYAQQAQLDMAYAYYKFDEPESAIAAADRFIKLYPRHARVDYAYYLKGLIKFDQVHSAFDKIAQQDPAQRDNKAALNSFQYFLELVQKFPNSPYAEDAIQRLTYLRNALARNELYSARHYVKLGAYVAAVNRAKYIVEHYYRTPSVPEALAIMINSYEALGIEDLAADTRKVFERNFPDQTAMLEKRGGISEQAN